MKHHLHVYNEEILQKAFGNLLSSFFCSVIKVIYKCMEHNSGITSSTRTNFNIFIAWEGRLKSCLNYVVFPLLMGGSSWQILCRGWRSSIIADFVSLIFNIAWLDYCLWVEESSGLFTERLCLEIFWRILKACDG